MDQGQIIEKGGHKSLLSGSTKYSNVYDGQMNNGAVITQDD